MLFGLTAGSDHSTEVPDATPSPACSLESLKPLDRAPTSAPAPLDVIEGKKGILKPSRKRYTGLRSFSVLGGVHVGGTMSWILPWEQSL